MSKCAFAAWFGKHVIVTVFAVTVTYAGASPPRGKPDTPAVLHWKSLVPAIEAVLTRSGFNCHSDRMHIGIVDASDLAADGLSYALIDFCQEGAYTDSIAAMELVGDKPVPVRFRKANGEALHLEFAQGASVMHSLDVKLVPEKKALYDMHSDNDGMGHLTKCSVEAYVWNETAKTFDWNGQLTQEATRSYCRSSQELLLKQH